MLAAKHAIFYMLLLIQVAAQREEKGRKLKLCGG